MIKTIFAVFLLAVCSFASARDPVAGAVIAKKACASCHGETGAQPIQDNPRLAGQYYDYLVVALSEYKSGKRQNPIMSGMVANLSRKDISDLAAYFSRQPAVVYTKY